MEKEKKMSNKYFKINEEFNENNYKKINEEKLFNKLYIEQITINNISKTLSKLKEKDLIKKEHSKNEISTMGAYKGRLKKKIEQEQRIGYLFYFLKIILNQQRPLSSLSIQEIEKELFGNKSNEKIYQKISVYHQNKTIEKKGKIKKEIMKEFYEILEKNPQLKEISKILMEKTKEKIEEEMINIKNYFNVNKEEKNQQEKMNIFKNIGGTIQKTKKEEKIVKFGDCLKQKN